MAQALRNASPRDDQPEPRHMSIDQLLLFAERLRPTLREHQQQCEARGFPSAEIFQALKDAGAFRILTPRRFGGFEMPLGDFYRMVIAIGRGCPSTGWWYALGAGHALQVASYFSETTQTELFGASPDFSASWSFNAKDTSIERVAGGYRVSGIWAYSSGVPHAPYFMGGLKPPAEWGLGDHGAGTWESPTIAFIIPSGTYVVYDDWSDTFGMRGSGSNSVCVDNVFVPEEFTLVMNRAAPIFGHTPGSRLHRNAMYAGLMNGVVEGGPAAAAVGAGLAAIDAYVDVISESVAGQPLAEMPRHQRQLGLALAKIDSAQGITLQGAALYHAHAEKAMRSLSAFDHEKGLRIDGMYHTAETMVWEAMQLLIRGAGSRALREASPLQRYFRDITTLCSRRDQLDDRAVDIGAQYLRKRGERSN
ncbi:acyl-CoA dehydrogenase family protein [Pandoraea cepalis]|nr:acyl-CoA dehydrogenase family protein [Pandoraea cepalis]